MTLTAKVNKILNVTIALVWLANGLIFKILNYVPRHQKIVSEILGTQYAEEITIAIGVLEISLAIWILTGLFPKAHAILQILVVLLMNIIERLTAPELLLWGGYNFFFALIFVAIVYFNYFILNTNSRNKYVTSS